MEIIYNPRDILKIFYDYDPLTHIPLVHKQEIKQFISKKKLQRLHSNVNFLETPISAVLIDLYEEITIDIFFANNIDHSTIKIPIIHSENFTLTSCSRQEFQLLFKPVNEIKNFNPIFEEINIAILIINSKHQIISLNNECQNLLQEWENKIQKPQFNLINFFLKTLANKIEQLANNKIHHLFIEEQNLRITFKVKTMNLPEGDIFIFSILTIVQDK